jgi:hypothetical protein
MCYPGHRRMPKRCSMRSTTASAVDAWCRMISPAISRKNAAADGAGARRTVGRPSRSASATSGAGPLDAARHDHVAAEHVDRVARFSDAGEYGKIDPRADRALWAGRKDADGETPRHRPRTGTGRVHDPRRAAAGEHHPSRLGNEAAQRTGELQRGRRGRARPHHADDRSSARGSAQRFASAARIVHCHNPLVTDRGRRSPMIRAASTICPRWCASWATK